MFGSRSRAAVSFPADRFHRLLPGGGIGLPLFQQPGQQRVALGFYEPAGRLLQRRPVPRFAPAGDGLHGPRPGKDVHRPRREPFGRGRGPYCRQFQHEVGPRPHRRLRPHPFGKGGGSPPLDGMSAHDGDDPGKLLPRFREMEPVAGMEGVVFGDDTGSGQGNLPFKGWDLMRQAGGKGQNSQIFRGIDGARLWNFTNSREMLEIWRYIY